MQGCVAFWRLPVPIRLSARKPEFTRLDGHSLGAKLERRRREFGLDRVEAAARLGCDPKTLMWWERDHRLPFVSFYPAIIEFLGYEPWNEPQSLAEALLAERRRRGMEIRRIAALIGVDEGAWRRWERGEWKPTRLTLPALDRLLRLSVAANDAGDVR